MLNENHRYFGEGHHMALLTDREVELLRRMAEELHTEGRSYNDIDDLLADKFGISKHTVGRIRRYERRNCHA